MAETVGDMIDRLTIANIRLWHIEDERREKAETASREEAVNLLNKVSKVNKERNMYIDQINAALKVLIDQAASRDSSFELSAEDLLGVGKNKHYKGEA